MTGLAAVALSGLFSSCSKDIETGEENTVEFNILQTYENAFVTRFGQPAENQTWGFGSHAGTRTENANANEWADPNKAYGGLLVPPAITPTQAAVVKTYFQTHDKLGYQDPGWSNYFIQQVYKGYSDVPDGCATPERYLSAAGGDAYIYASDHMDHLIAVDTERGIVDHINNFNHGDCGENYNVLDNGGNANDGPFHTDKIMYMQNSTTKSFAYHNSDGSLYHTEYTGLVGWETIHNWAVDNYPGYDGCLNDGWKRSFMGFDFEQIVGDDVYSKNVEYDYERIQDYSGYDPIQEMIEDIQYKLYVEELKKCLPPSEAELFECVVSKGLSLDEATEVLHISRNLLHVRVFRMKQHIREFLEEKKKSFDSM
jgi:hypothetical protein